MNTEENIKKIVLEILSKGYLMSLGTVDDDGVWVSDVNYIYDNDLNIYWASKITTRHSEAIEKQKNVAATITVSTKPGEKNMGLQIEGQAHILENYNLEFEKKLLTLKEKVVEEKLVMSTDQSWYILEPKRLEVIYEPLWGFHKEILEIK